MATCVTTAKRAALAGTLALALLGGCDDSARDYYPLGLGATWTYAVSGDQGNTPFGTESTVANLPAQSLNSVTVTPQMTTLFDQQTIRYMRRTDAGVAEVAHSDPVDAPPKMLAEPNYVLKSPLEPGTTWESIWQTSQTGTPQRFPITKTVTMVDATVTVTAGTFDDCLKLSITGSTAMTVDGEDITVDVSGEEWYAPDVGYIKGVFEETVPGHPDRTVRLAFDLTEKDS